MHLFHTRYLHNFIFRYVTCENLALSHTVLSHVLYCITGAHYPHIDNQYQFFVFLQLFFQPGWSSYSKISAGGVWGTPKEFYS